MEGSTGRSDRRICAGGGQFYPPDDPVPGKYDDLSDGCDESFLYRYRREDDRMHAADRGESIKT